MSESNSKNITFFPKREFIVWFCNVGYYNLKNNIESEDSPCANVAVFLLQVDDTVAQKLAQNVKVSHKNFINSKSKEIGLHENM